MAKRIATLEDLRTELWLRERESGSLVWKTKTGDEIPIKNMGDTHLINTIAMLSVQEAHKVYEQEAMDCCDCLDKDYCDATDM